MTHYTERDDADAERREAILEYVEGHDRPHPSEAVSELSTDNADAYREEIKRLVLDGDLIIHADGGLLLDERER